MKTVLIIVHPSCMDSYRYVEGRDASDVLSSAMIAAILNHNGPVYIVVDPEWEVSASHTKKIFAAAKQREEVSYILSGDDAEGWVHLAYVLPNMLKENGVGKVILGGLWYYHDENSNLPSKMFGCVNEVYYLLKRLRVPVVIDPDLVGQERDGEKYTLGEVLDPFGKLQQPIDNPKSFIEEARRIGRESAAYWKVPVYEATDREARITLFQKFGMPNTISIEWKGNIYPFGNLSAVYVNEEGVPQAVLLPKKP